MNFLKSRFYYYFSVIVAAVKGTEKDFVNGSIKKAIVLLAIPMILEMVMESLFAVVDIYFVGKVSVNAIATVTLTESVIMIIFSIAIGMSMAATATVSRRIGEKQPEKAGRAAGQAIIIATVLSLVFSVLGIAFARDILRLMGGEEDLINEGQNYTRIMLGGNMTIMFLFLINAIFRGAGDASIAMRALWLANGINIVLDPIFIFGLGPIPAFGVEGAAIATTLGRAFGVCYQLYRLSKDSIIIIKLKDFFPDPIIIRRLINISLGGISQYLIGTASWIFMVRISAEFGSAVLAGYALAFRVIMFTILPSWGLANAGATLVGQNLGAGKPDRAEKSVWLCSFYNMIFLAMVSVVFIFFADSIIGIFSQDIEVVKIGSMALTYIGFGYVFYSYGMVIGQAFNGAGDTRTPTIINFIVFWLIEAPMGYFLAITMGFGPNGIFSAISGSVVIFAIVSIVIFRRGKWKESIV